MTTDQDLLYSVPSKEELANNSAGYLPVEADDYVCQIAKITLEHQPTWDNVRKQMDYNNTELKYTLMLLPLKPKAEDEIFDVQGNVVEPLSCIVWRTIPSFSMNFNADGEPSFLRGIVAYAQDQSPTDDGLKVPGIVVIDRDGNIASEADREEYISQLIKVKKGELSADAFTKKKAGFKDIPDIRPLEGQYIGAKIITEDKNGKLRNKITGFSKRPRNLVVDKTLEKTAKENFDKAYQAILDNRKEKGTAPVTTGETIQVSDEVEF